MPIWACPTVPRRQHYYSPKELELELENICAQLIRQVEMRATSSDTTVPKAKAIHVTFDDIAKTYSPQTQWQWQAL